VVDSEAQVEPVFGHIKEARSFRRFHLRSIGKVRGEWALVCIGHNLRKLHSFWLRGRLPCGRLRR
jgi:hypothetical protein